MNITEAQKAGNKRYREKHREEINRKNRERYQQNIEKERERSRAKYYRDKEKTKEQKRKWNAENKEQLEKYQAQYRELNKDKELARSKRWYEQQDPVKLYQKRKQRQLELHGTNAYYITPERNFKMYQRNAKKRNISFDITFEDFKQHWQQQCYYCNDYIETIGIDRLDNNKGYTKDNIVSCCRLCNWMKNKFDASSFIEQCMKITDTHYERKLKVEASDASHAQ